MSGQRAVHGYGRCKAEDTVLLHVKNPSKRGCTDRSRKKALILLPLPWQRHDFIKNYLGACIARFFYSG